MSQDNQELILKIMDKIESLGDKMDNRFDRINDKLEKHSIDLHENSFRIDTVKAKLDEQEGNMNNFRGEIYQLGVEVSEVKGKADRFDKVLDFVTPTPKKVVAGITFITACVTFYFNAHEWIQKVKELVL